MAGERSVRISFEAREELSRAVQQIDTALDGLKSSLATTIPALEGTGVSAEGLEEDLEDVGQEATGATAKLSSLIGASAGLQAAFAGMGDDIDIDVPLDDVEDGAVSFDALRDSLLDFGDATELAEIDEDHALRQLADEKKMPLDDVIRKIRTADARLQGIGEEGPTRQVDVPVNIETEELNREVQTATEEAESAAREIGIPLGVDEGQQSYAMMEVGKATKAIEESEASTVDLSLRVPDGQKTYALLETAKATKAIEASTANNVDINFDVSDDALKLFTLASSLTAVQAQAIAATASTRSAASSIDKMGDEATESAAEMGVLQSVMNVMSLNTTALSLNVGAFNIALANLATQIPILIALLGTLLTVIMGVAGAVVLAGGAFAGLFGGAFLGEVERVEEQFENIEGKAEAMQAIMQSLGDAFIEAFEPLIEAGSDADLFFSTVNNALETINVFAKVVADSMEFSTTQMEEFIAVGEGLGIIDEEMSDSEVDSQIMSLSEFFDELGRIWQDNVDDIIRATQIMSAFMLPVLADMIEFFMDGFDDMILFITKFTNELTVIGPAIEDLINFGVQLVDLGSTILQGLLPVFVGLLSIATEVAEMFNALDPAIVRNVAGIAALALVVSKAVGAYRTLSENIALVIKGTVLERIAMEKNAAIMAINTGYTTRLSAAKAALIGTSQTLITTLKSSRAATLASSAANFSLMASTKGVISSIRGALTTIKGYIVGANAGTISTLALSVAMTILNASTGGLLTAIGTIITALAVLLGAIGGVIVGLSSSDDVMAGLGSTLSAVKSVIVDFGMVFLDALINIGNSVVDTVTSAVRVVEALGNSLNSIGEALGIVSGEASGMSTIMAILSGTLEAVLLPFEILWAVISGVARVISAVLVGSIQFWTQVITGLIDGLSTVIDWVLNFLGISGGVDDAVSTITDAIMGLIDAILNLPDTIKSAFSILIDIIEGAMNFVIDAINAFITAIPKGVRDAAGIGTMDHVDLGDTQSDVSREDVVGGDGEEASTAEDDLAAQLANEFNYNEETINNTSQEINADPEDKASLERTVKDAMAEAESFARRQQGGM